MTPPWTQDGFPPLAPRPFDPDLDEATFDYLGDTFRDHDLIGVEPVVRSSGVVLVNRPDEAWHVLGRNHANYVKGIGVRKVRMLLGKGVIAVEGKAWRDRRRVLQPSFHQKAVARLADLMVSVNRRFVDKWCEQAEAGEPIDVSTDTARLTLEIMVQCLFGSDLPRLTEEGGDIPFSVLTDDLDRTLSTVHRLQADRQRLRALIEERRGRAEPEPDLLGVLVAARDEETGEPLETKSILDEAVTLAVAGHETSASALSWAWYLLSGHPEIEARLHEEIDGFDDPGPGTASDLERMPFTRRVLDEVLRMYPPGWILTRRALEDDEVGGYRIPKGTHVVVSPYYLHRNPEYWDEPDRFDPDRFLEPPKHKRAYIPFGAGPRRCIGDVLGLFEMQFHLALVARRLKLSYLGKGHPTIEAKVNLRPKEQLMFRGELR